ncbi:Cutinase transcription factor 1 beta variant 3 [Penicillium riverlandense]|uniref:Cutinase transcription factor 1 beta variant 3 n=1 Tax=Penicillium riverlandense TaxID=1903569 RepID=UPI0025472FF4|nr:Cutinase transcription factor 1 beta variant 3 [Penicillium riverlandense]KAJ5832260.1 Cutinase transcription factor 1 beta variant 3 [Penicillium riverlandense]
MLLFHDSFGEHFRNTSTNLSSPGPSPTETSDLAASLPGFIRPLPLAFSPAKVEYLQTHGVLTLPSIPLQNALLRTFTECVLPCMPVIEWHRFVHIINGRDGRKGYISLLLYHAVMFSATTFVDFEHLLEAGYSSTRELQEMAFQKTKLLYESDYESDELIVIQTLLLMTYRSETAGENEIKQWLDLAISMAQTIGLFQNQLGTEDSLYSPRMRKRIGWACYMTDCQISLRLRCRPSIKKEGFYHPMLTLDDFEIYTQSAEGQRLINGCPLARDIKKQRDLALICVSHARLCVCISEVLEIQGKNGQLHSLDELPPPSCQYRLLHSGDSSDGNSTLFVQRSLLHMVYYTTIAVLHQSQIFPSSKIRVHDAAHQITRIASELHKRRLHNCLSITGVTAILVAMVIHISVMRVSLFLQREEAMDDYKSCMVVMASLQDVHSEANAVTNWMFRAMASVALDGGPNCHGQDSELSLSGDLTVNPSFLHSNIFFN